MEYKIFGGHLPILSCDLTDGEAINTESGAMAFMDENISLEVSSGGIKKMFSSLFTGQSVFKNKFTANGDGNISLSTNFPGEIIPFELNNNSLICQKASLLAYSENIDTSIFFNSNILASMFGGEGFIMQKFSGTGLVFMQIIGSAHEYTLAAGETKIIDTGKLVAMEETCSMDIKQVGGLKSTFLGGYGFFNTIVTGPGKIILQSMTIYNMAQKINQYLPKPQAPRETGF